MNDDQLHNDRQHVRAIMEAMHALNQRLAEAGRAGLTVKIDVLDETTFGDHVRVYNVGIKVSRETQYN